MTTTTQDLKVELAAMKVELAVETKRAASRQKVRGLVAAVEVVLMSGEDVTQTVTDLVAMYSADVAAMWRENPNRRAEYAAAFVAGFSDPDNSVAQVVLEAAEQDLEAARVVTLRKDLMRAEMAAEHAAL